MSPVIVSFAEKSTPVWEIPFPAITICPETKVLKKYADFTKGHHAVLGGNNFDGYNMSHYERTVIEAVTQVCDPHLFQRQNQSIGSGLKAEDIVPLLKSVTMTLGETTLYCKWRNDVNLCDEYFTEIITEEGFCYTFNVLKSDELFKENV